MFGKKKTIRPEMSHKAALVRKPVSAAMLPSAGLQASVLEKKALEKAAFEKDAES